MEGRRSRSYATILLMLAFSFWCWQVYWWRDHAIRITQFQVWALFGRLNLGERLEWGAICNGLENFDCAAEVFSGVVRRSPRHRLGLVNLAIAEARRHRCREAKKFFADYRSTGPDGPEALYWEGKCLLQLKNPEGALAAWYASASLSAEASEAPEALVDLLIGDGRIEEALSVIGALSQGRPTREIRWRKKFAEVMLKLQWQDAQIGEPVSGGKKAVRLPSFDGQRFWMPVRYAPQTAMEYVVVDLDQPNFTIDEDQLLHVAFDLKDRARQPADNGPALKFNLMQVGPWFFEDIEFKVCRQCVSTLGRSVLDHFEVSEEIGPGVKFLTLTSN